MTRRLWALNLALVTAVAFTAWRIHVTWAAARAAEQKLVGRKLPPVPPPAVQAPVPPAPVAAVDYAVVAEKMLFAKDRNPTVIVEVEKPKPMPPLPAAYGVIRMGDQPMALLSESGSQIQKAVMRGDKIGEFRLLDVGDEELVFEWEGDQIRRSIKELQAKAAAQPAPAGQAQRTAAPTERTTNAGQAATTIAATGASTGPGKDLGSGYKSCQPGDTAPVGTIRDGYRKSQVSTPFGQGCRWELVK